MPDLQEIQLRQKPELFVVDETVPMPGTDAFFGGASDPDCTKGGVAFLGGARGFQGVFRRDLAGAAHLVLAKGGELDGLLLSIIRRLDADERSGSLALLASLVEVGVRSARGVVFLPAGGQPVLVLQRSRESIHLRSPE